MLDSRFIYDIRATTLPCSKELLDFCLDKKPITSFVLCKYERLMETIRTINYASEISGTLNGKVLFDSINNPETSYDCVIKIEGMKSTNDNYLNHVIRSKDKITWTDFKTYSQQLRSEIKGMKEAIFRKTLWISDNIDSWFETCDIQLPDKIKMDLNSSWPMFKETVIDSGDLDKFISCCSDESKANYRQLIYKNSAKLLDRYRAEIMAHATQQNKNDEEVTIRKPIVMKIYVMSNLYSRCLRDWPSLRVSSLNKKSLETLGLYL